MRTSAALAILLALLLSTAGFAADKEHAEHEHPVSTPVASAPTLTPPAQTGVGVTENLGAYLPDDVLLLDEQGKSVNLKELVTMPSILVPIYYTCPNDCNLLLGMLAQVLPKVALAPGKEFQVLCVSFDETDTPALAARRKNDFMTAAAKGFPETAWRFLTGDLPTVQRLMRVIGFGFKREGKAFQHAMVMVAVSPSGKIVRYLYGAAPLPFDITMAATEAAEDKIGLSVKRAIAFCYSYDPQGRRYVFSFMKVAGVSILAGMLLFLGFLILGGKKKPQGKQ